MLRKLIKYEWKHTGRICGALILFMVLMTVLGCLSFCTPMWSGMFANEFSGITPLDVVGFLSLFLYIFAMIGVSYGVMIYLGVHFYKSMYSDEGYLTHTLPVTSHQLLCSKTLVAGLWYLLVCVLMVASVLALVLTVVQRAMGAQGLNLFEELAGNWSQIGGALEMILGVSLIKEILFYVLQIVVGTFCSVLILFGAITVGQLSSKHKVMMAILSYFGITTVIQVVASLVMVPITFHTTQIMMEENYMTFGMSTMPTFVATTVLNLVVAAVMYALSNWIITRKLNLD